MHNYIFFGLILLSICSNASLLAMESGKMYDLIVNKFTSERGYKRGYWYYGKKVFSHVCNDKSFTIIDYDGHNSKYLYSSLLDLETGIDHPYQPLAIKATVCHLLDTETAAVGHQKLHILKEKFNFLQFLKNIYAEPRTYTLEIVQTLTPHLEDQSSDHLTFIDSCDSHLIALSSQGYITTWQRPSMIKDVNDNSREKTHCDKPFFSAGFNKKEKILCLGLNNGKIFIADIMNLNNFRIIDFLTEPIKINCISISENDFLFAGIDEEKKIVYEKESNGCSSPRTIDCCKYNGLPANPCLECQAQNKSNTKISLEEGDYNIQQLNNIQKKLNDEIAQKNNVYCEHTQKERETSSEICNSCRDESHYAIISAQQLKTKDVCTSTQSYKKNQRKVIAFHLIDDNNPIVLHKKRGMDNDTKLKAEITSLSSASLNYSLPELFPKENFQFLPRGNGYFSVIWDNGYYQTLHDTNKNIAHTLKKIVIALQRDVSRIPYWFLPFLPLGIIIRTPWLYVPTLSILAASLYYKINK